jgi:hypothetical protein
MKRLIVLCLAVFVSIAFISIGEAQKKKAPAKENPCVTDCKKEDKKCMAEAKKAPKADRKAKIADCNKALKDCKDNCNKPKEPSKETK